MSRFIRQSIIGAGLVFLVGCSVPEPQVVTYTAEPIEKPALILPTIKPLSLQAVEYIVVTKDNVSEIVSQLENSDGTMVFYALTSDGYKTQTLNSAKILELVSNQKSVIAAYERFYVTR
jgi:hypothetical protein